MHYVSKYRYKEGEKSFSHYSSFKRDSVLSDYDLTEEQMLYVFISPQSIRNYFLSPSLN